MTHTYQPGDLALVECSDGEWRRAMYRIRAGDKGHVWRFSDASWLSVSAVAARPLVVIDPESDADGVRFGEAVKEAMGMLGTHSYPDIASAILREYLTPTPPPLAEPMGLGDLVTDRDGYVWVRCHDGHFAQISAAASLPSTRYRFTLLACQRGPLTSGKGDR